MNPIATAPRPIRTVLIANRGEIACRVMRTCRRLGLRSIAIYSDADADALHVRTADEAHHVGGAAAAESYLNIDAILAAARASGADAIHPGYGFLSENAEFARRCGDEGVIFVGPSPAAVAAMGSKIEAKKIAVGAGVATVPGYHGSDQSALRLENEAVAIGFPVLIKASAGGGGRGMRLIERAEEFAAALQSAKAEARSAFGDDAVLLEKYIANPRHLEVQIVGDMHGNIVHLFERDCSVQRNNQKVLEEAPAPNLSDGVRETLFDAALRLGRTIGYSSAGTVEFIMEAGGAAPYFLEMNTRLQVEHPVTEAITGLDLVEWQLLVAAGLPLPLRQDQIHRKGHAIEARLAAERPDAGYQPSVGRIVHVTSPTGLRFDTGVATGSSVGLRYDSMIAKLIAHGPDRDAAVARLSRGLEDLALLGLPTNQAFLRDCVMAPAFADGRATTRFLTEAFPEGWQPDAAALANVRALAAILWAEDRASDDTRVWHRMDGFRIMGARRPAHLSLTVTDEFGTADVQLTRNALGYGAAIGGAAVPLGWDRTSEYQRIDGRPVHGRVDGGTVHAAHGGLSISATVIPAIDVGSETELSAAGAESVLAPLPGLVTAIAVKPGDKVAKGDMALQIEAMKLVHTLTVEVDGTVRAVHCKVGDTVAAGATLIEMASETEE